MAAVLAVGSVPQPGWYAAAAGPETEYTDIKTAEKAEAEETAEDPGGQTGEIQLEDVTGEEYESALPQENLIPPEQTQSFVETEEISAGPPDVLPEIPGTETSPDISPGTEPEEKPSPDNPPEVVEPEPSPDAPAEGPGTEQQPSMSQEVPGVNISPETPETEASPDTSPGTESEEKSSSDVPAEVPGVDISPETPGTEASPDTSPGTESEEKPSPDNPPEVVETESSPDAPAEVPGTEQQPGMSQEVPEIDISPETEESRKPDTETEGITILEKETEAAEGTAPEKDPEEEQDMILGPETEPETLPEEEQDTPSDELDEEPAEDTETGTDAMYAILYESGELVFQRGETPDPGKGNVQESMTGFENLSFANKYSWPWYNTCRLSIRAVSFKDRFCPATAESMFSGCKNLISFDSRNFDTSSLTNTGNMFYNCTSLSSLDTGGWRLSSVTETDYMFYNCAGLTALDTGGWKLSAVKKMDYMFYGCSGLTELDMSSWDMSQVTSMGSIFGNCRFYRLVLGPMCRLNPGILQEDIWVRTSSGQQYTAEELCGSYDGAVMADTYCRQIKVMFEGNEGTADPAFLQTYIGAVPDRLPSAVRRGYLLDGWFTEKSGGSRLEPGYPIAQEKYYAHWTARHYTLVLRNGEDEEFSKELAYDELYTLPSGQFTKEHMKLEGWSTHEDGSGLKYEPDEEVCMLTDEDGGKVTLYAQWAEISPKVHVFFDTQEGGAIDPLEIMPGDIYGKTVAGIIPSREGYTFIAWHKGSPDGAVVESSDCAEQEDIFLFAEWKRNPVITFDTNGGGPEISRKQIKYGGKIGTLPKYPSGSSKAFFTGWFTETAGGDEVKPDWVIYEDVTYYAHWSWKPVFDANGGMFTELPEYPPQESPEYLIHALPEVRCDGCRLAGWFLEDEVTEVKAEQVLDLSLGSKITARWERMDTVKLTLDPSPSNGEFSVSGKETYEVYLNQPVRVLPDPKYKPSGGRKFLGWFDEEGIQWTEDTVITKDTVLHALWSGTAVRITFNADGGSGLSQSSLLVPAGSTIDVLPGARKNTYILEGWYTEKNGEGEKLTTETVILKETTYYAHWVSFFLNTSDQAAFYVYGAEWGNASNENADVIDDTLIVHPTDTSDQTAQLHVRFEMNVSVGDFVLPAGAVKIRIPKYVWKDWEGNDIGTDNLSVNLPQYPDIRSGMFFSYIDEGDHYLLVNNQELAGGAGVDVVISYKVKPKDVPGGASDAQGQYVDGYEYYKGKAEVTFYVDMDQDEEAETVRSKELFLEMHTRISGSPTKELQSIYYNWQNEWGERPEDAEDYFYAKWELRTHFSVNTNQPGTYEWTEDGMVHDGTVVVIRSPKGTVSSTGYVSEVIVRYPVALLRDAPAEGLLLHNEVLLTVSWKSGYKTVQKAQAEKRIYKSSYPPGDFGKQRPYYTSTESEKNRLIQGGQEKLTDDETDVSMQWKIAYKGGAGKVPDWNEKTGTYTVPERTIRIRDGLSKDMLYSSGKSSAKYVWEPETGNVALADSDYSFTELKVNVQEYDAECRDGLWTSEKSHDELDDVKGVDIYVRYRGSDQLSYWTNIPGSGLGSGKTITFPEGTVGFELRHKSSFYLTKISLQLSAKVHPTRKMKTLVSLDMEAGATSLIKNKAYCDVWETESGEDSIYFSATNYTGGKTSALKEIWELNMSQTVQCACKKASKTGNVVLDVGKGTQDNPIYIAGWNCNSSGNAKQLRKGILYDLLPAGTTVDISSLFGFAVTGYVKLRPGDLGDKADLYEEYKKKPGKLSVSNYDVRFSEDWMGSGRTMMIITFTLPDSPKIVGAEFYYLLHNTYENILLHGTTVENDLAFVNTSSGRVRPAELTGKQSVIEDSRLYDELQAKYEGFIAYAEASVNYVPVDAYSWGFEKSVKTYSDYSSKGEAFPGTEYTYKLSYSQSESAQSSGIVFYDLLEGGYFVQDDSGQQKMESQWHGAFTGVDVHEIAQKLTGGSNTVRCNPVVWYATKDRNSFAGEDFDLSRTDIWSMQQPEDLSTVTAVAVDCRKNTDGTEFILVNRQVMDVYIGMRAPENVPQDAVYTYNEGCALAKQKNDEEPTTLTSDAQVEIIAGEPELHKKSDPESGTEENPAPLEQKDSLNYTLSVTNNGTVRTMTDIIVEDEIPDGLSVESSEITVWFSDAEERLKVSESPRISMTKSGRHLKFVISTLLAGETAYIMIPCEVSVKEGLLVNTAHVTSVDGVKKNVTSETTYHKVEPLGTLCVRKTVKGSLGDRSRPFSFRLKFTVGERELPELWNCRKGEVEFTAKPDKEGYLTFSLSDGESIEFLGVPRGTGYEVEETDGTSLGYKVESENSQGTIGDKSAQVSFVNTKNGFVPTGVWGGLYRSLILVLAAAAAVIRMILKRRIQG